jgi:hypothetical protein
MPVAGMSVVGLSAVGVPAFGLPTVGLFTAGLFTVGLFTVGLSMSTPPLSVEREVFRVGRREKLAKHCTESRKISERSTTASASWGNDPKSNGGAAGRN